MLLHIDDVRDAPVLVHPLNLAFLFNAWQKYEDAELVSELVYEESAPSD